MANERIFARDGNICRYCEVPLTKENRTIDHILPKSKGGKNESRNYAAACRTCNFLKGNKLVSPLLGIGEILKRVKQPPPPRKKRVHKVKSGTKKREVKKVVEMDWEKVEKIRQLYAELCSSV